MKQGQGCKLAWLWIQVIQQTSNTNKISFLNRLHVTVQPKLVVKIKTASEYLVSSTIVQLVPCIRVQARIGEHRIWVRVRVLSTTSVSKSVSTTTKHETKRIHGRLSSFLFVENVPLYGRLLRDENAKGFPVEYKNTKDSRYSSSSSSRDGGCVWQLWWKDYSDTAQSMKNFSVVATWLLFNKQLPHRLLDLVSLQ